MNITFYLMKQSILAYKKRGDQIIINRLSYWWKRGYDFQTFISRSILYGKIKPGSSPNPSFPTRPEMSQTQLEQQPSSKTFKRTEIKFSFQISAYRNPYSWQDSNGRQLYRTYQILDPNSCFNFRGRMVCKPIEWPQRKKPSRELSATEIKLKKAWFQNF